MIKGVNKQIVEINYTKNDYIEKAILIINPCKADVPKEIISKKADEYMKTITNQAVGEKKSRNKQITALSKAAILTFAALILIGILLLFFL